MALVLIAVAGFSGPRPSAERLNTIGRLRCVREDGPPRGTGFYRGVRERPLRRDGQATVFEVGIARKDCLGNLGM